MYQNIQLPRDEVLKHQGTHFNLFCICQSIMHKKKHICFCNLQQKKNTVLNFLLVAINFFFPSRKCKSQMNISIVSAGIRIYMTPSEICTYNIPATLRLQL